MNSGIVVTNKRGETFNVGLLKSGDILSVGALQFAIYGKPIQWLTHSKYNHSGIIIEEIETVPDMLRGEPHTISYVKYYVYEAMGKFKKTPIEDYLKSFEENKNILTVTRVKEDTFGCDLYDYYEKIYIACERARRALGMEYDWRNIAGLFFISITKTLFRNLKVKNNWLNKKNKVICSEAICEFFHFGKNKISIFIGNKDKKATCSTITPGDIVKAPKCKYVTGTPIK